MNSETRFSHALVLVVLLVLAGCSSGSGPISAGASAPATVDSAALDAAGYQQAETRNVTFNTTVRASISGDVEMSSTRDVTAEMRITEYSREIDVGPASVSVVSSPAVHPIEDQSPTRDPFATLSTERQVTLGQRTYANLSEFTLVENGTVTLLGNETDLLVYEASGVPESEASGNQDANSVRLTVYLASVQDGDDYVSIVAVVPRDADEQERVIQLMEAVGHQKR